jgi:hypothetical protein
MRLAEAAVTNTERSGAAKIHIHPDRVRRRTATFAAAALSGSGAVDGAANLAAARCGRYLRICSLAADTG